MKVIKKLLWDDGGKENIGMDMTRDEGNIGMENTGDEGNIDNIKEDRLISTIKVLSRRCFDDASWHIEIPHRIHTRIYTQSYT